MLGSLLSLLCNNVMRFDVNPFLQAKGIIAYEHTFRPSNIDFLIALRFVID